MYLSCLNFVSCSISEQRYISIIYDKYEFVVVVVWVVQCTGFIKER